MSAEREVIYFAIDAERQRQDMLRPGDTPADDIDPFRKLAFLVEEVGEASEALQERDDYGLAAELVQVAAVAVAWLESL